MLQVDMICRPILTLLEWEPVLLYIGGETTDGNEYTPDIHSIHT